MKVLTFSRHFPKGHPRQGEPTWFVESVLNSVMRKDGILNLDDLKPEVRALINDFALTTNEKQKDHTLRAGSRFKPGDMASLRVWSDKPYRSKQIVFAQVEVKKVWEIEISEFWFINNSILEHGKVIELANNDGLSYDDFIAWFNIHPKKKSDVFRGQIICWDENIEYLK